jgi:hypothetical protein
MDVNGVFINQQTFHWGTITLHQKGQMSIGCRPLGNPEISRCHMQPMVLEYLPTKLPNIYHPVM